VALYQVKTRKAGDLSGIVILFGGSVLQDRLLALMKDVFNEGRVVNDLDALIIPVYHRKVTCNLVITGVALAFRTLYKVFARVIQNVIAKGLLSDSQCGFHKGRRCTDIIFATRHNKALPNRLKCSSGCSIQCKIICKLICT